MKDLFDCLPPHHGEMDYTTFRTEFQKLLAITMSAPFFHNVYGQYCQYRRKAQ